MKSQISVINIQLWWHRSDWLTCIHVSEDSHVEGRRKVVRKRKRKQTEQEDFRAEASESEEEEEEEGVDLEIDRQLDQSLESKSKQHNLTTVNVRNIIHVSLSKDQYWSLTDLIVSVNKLFSLIWIPHVIKNFLLCK